MGEPMLMQFKDKISLEVESEGALNEIIQGFAKDGKYVTAHKVGDIWQVDVIII